MDLQDIDKMWAKDSQIDEVMLDQASIKIPQIHCKYLTLHSQYQLLLKKKEQQLKQAKHHAWLYYSGKAAPEVYEQKPFDYKVMKSDIMNWVEVDEQVTKTQIQLDYYRQTIYVLEEILKQIHQMSYNIKNIIAWRSFTGGV